MTGTEKQVLKIIKELEEGDNNSIARTIAVSKRYVAETCLGLVKDGYLLEIGNEKYKLTEKGKKAISSVKTTGPIPVLKGGM